MIQHPIQKLELSILKTMSGWLLSNQCPYMDAVQQRRAAAGNSPLANASVVVIQIERILKLKLTTNA